MDCSKITKGLIAATCGKNATAGLEDDVLLINFDDIDRTLSVVEDNVITSIVLKSGAKAYKFTTIGRSLNDMGGTLTKGTYRDFWLHSLPLRIFTKNEDSKAFVNDLTAGARLVPVIKNKETGVAGDVKYEALGWDNGLELNEGTFSAAMTDGVVYDITLSSTDTAQESSLPKSIFDTDLATTEAMIDSLTV